MKKVTALFVVLCMVLPLLPMVISAQDTTLYIKAEDFKSHLGTWKITTPTEDAVAKAELNFIKSVKPPVAESAFVSFEIPEKGDYFIWALTRDYAGEGVASSNRTFKIALNATPVDKLFGTHGQDGWAWEKSGPVTLEKGACTLELIDSSRNYGRCMAFAVTTDPSFQGPMGKAALEKVFQAQGITLLENVPSPTPNVSAKPSASPTASPTPKPTYIPEQIAVQSTRPDDEIAVKLNGQYLVFQDDSKPYTLNDRTLVPFRAIFEALGCTVDWDDTMQTATGIRGNTKISLPVGNALAAVSGESVYLDQPAVLNNARVSVPIRFVAESLGAEVAWEEADATVVIYAQIPASQSKQAYLFTAGSFVNNGTWSASAAANGSLPTGILTGGTGENPSDTVPAVAYFNVTKPGIYKVWVRSRDYPANQPGTRFFNVAVNQQDLGMPFGTHGMEGFHWADGGTVTLPEGTNQLELLDTSDFYARCDGVLITEDLTAVPSEQFEALQKSAEQVFPTTGSDRTAFPSYAKEEGTLLSEEVLENEHTRVTFYTVQTSKGVVVQNQIESQKDGQFFVTKPRSEDFGFLVIGADTATLERPLLDAQIFSTSYRDSFGNAKAYYGSNIYKAGSVHWMIPTGVTVSGETAQLTFESDLADFNVSWSLEGALSAVQVSATYHQPGSYTIGIFEGGELPAAAIDQAEIVPADPGVLQLKSDGFLTQQKGDLYIKKGLNSQETTGFCFRGPQGNFRATSFWPLLGSEESLKNAGDHQTVQCQIISTVE